MEIRIDLNEAIKGEFSRINLMFTDVNGVEQKIPLMLRNFVDAFDLTGDIESIKFDLFLISALVYGIDNLIARKYYSNDGWSRDLKVTFPVYHLNRWKGQKELLQDALKFLTGDYWEIDFVLNTITPMYQIKGRRWKKYIKHFNPQNIKTTSLFSGGLDSLIGVIDQLESLDKGQEILLVSHFDFKSSGPNRDQQLLLKALKQKYPDKIKNNWIQIKLALSRTNLNGDSFQVEGNYRSRSFFFIGLGCYLSPSANLIVPENGTISINYPLTPSRVSSLSTRTTHPYVIDKLQNLVNNLGIDVQLQNPYKFDTKGEMVKNCSNYDLLVNILKNSTSCGKPGHNTSWENKNTNHCGVCMPCIYRRASLNKAKLDDHIYGRDITQPLSKNSFVDLPALISYLKRDISLEKMKRDILINGSLSFDELEKYAQMVLRSKSEVLQLFMNKGNNFIKAELGIR